MLDTLAVPSKQPVAGSSPARRANPPAQLRPNVRHISTTVQETSRLLRARCVPDDLRPARPFGRLDAGFISCPAFLTAGSQARLRKLLCRSAMPSGLVPAHPPEAGESSEQE